MDVIKQNNFNNAYGMNTTKKFTVKKSSRPNNEVLESIRSFARAYESKYSKRTSVELEWVVN